MLTKKISLALDKPEMQNRWWCDAHGFCHSERLPEYRPDCWLEARLNPDDSQPPSMRLAPRAKASLAPITLALDTHLLTGGPNL
jgi:hypothetical protein